MIKKKTFVFIFSLIALFLLPSIMLGQKKFKKIEKVDTIPLYQGLMIGADMYQPVSAMLGNSFCGGEMFLEANFKNKYFPIIELGGGVYERTKNNIEMNMVGGCTRLGPNYKMFGDQLSKNYGYFLCRYGFAYQNYDYENFPVIDSYWQQYRTANMPDQSAYTHWMGIGFGVKVSLNKVISLGWSFMYNYRLYQTECDYGKPYFVPGYGTNNAQSIWLNYSIYYRLK